MHTVHEKAKLIRLLILDVDGVLTSGIIFYGTNDIEIKGFHIHDGIGIKLLQKCGVKVGIISAKKSEAVSRRLKDLNVEHAYLGYEEKLPAYEDIKTKLNLSDQEIAYMGDDLPDLPILRRVGLALTVPQAPLIVKEHVDFTTQKKAGKGAVREIAELILIAQDKYQTMIQSYLDR